jgi:hypothetical protein
MKIRLIYEGREITGDFLCDYCQKGKIQIKAALKRFGSDKLAQLEKVEKWRQGYNDFVARAKQGKLNAYDFYAENVKQEAEYSSVSSLPSSIDTELSAFCDKCGKQVFFQFSASPVALADALTNDDLANLPLPSEEVLGRIAARMRVFSTVEEFKNWLNNSDSIQKASAILTKAVQELSKLNDPDIQRVTETIREVPAFLERKARERRREVLKLVQEQVRIDRSFAEEEEVTA